MGFFTLVLFINQMAFEISLADSYIALNISQSYEICANQSSTHKACLRLE
jgi:hypothetical protein